MLNAARFSSIANLNANHVFLFQYIDDLEVIGTNQPQHSFKFDMMSIVQEEEEEESEAMDETVLQRLVILNFL